MSGTSFQYEPGAIGVIFRHGDCDCIEVSMSLRGDVRIETTYDNKSKPVGSVAYACEDVHLESYMSSVFCPFVDLIAWLEAMTCGVQECAFEWDAEGPEGRLQWRSRCMDDTGFIEVTWNLDEAKHQHSVMLRRHQLVQAFYTAFRAFVESAAYDPQRYERPKHSGSPLGAMRSPMVESWLNASLH